MIFAAFPYKSPREASLTPEEARIREAAYALKTAEPWAIQLAGAAMANRLVSENRLDTTTIPSLIPIPNSKGDTSANLALCQEIQRVLNLWFPSRQARTDDILRKTEETKPQHQLKEGKRQKPSQLKLTLRAEPDHWAQKILVDNVICSGNTFKACDRLVLNSCGLFFADARNTHRILQDKRRIQSQFEAAEIRTLSTLRSSTPFFAQSPREIERYHREYVQISPQYHPERENVVLILLDNKLKILGHEFITQGTKNDAAFKHAELLRPVVASGAASFIVTHNHPSGDITPSQEDRKCTAAIREAAQILQTNFQDHIILGEAKAFFSFRDAGLC